MAANKGVEDIVPLSIQPPAVIASGNDPSRVADDPDEGEDDDEDNESEDQPRTLEGQPAQKRSEDDPDVRLIQGRQSAGERLDLDPRTLDKGFTYRWVNKSQKYVSRRKAKGYVVVDPRRESKIKNYAGEVLEPHADNTYTEQDAILMKCPKRIHRIRRAAVELDAQNRLGVKKKQIRKGFMRKARGANVEVIDTQESG